MILTRRGQAVAIFVIFTAPVWAALIIGGLS